MGTCGSLNESRKLEYAVAVGDEKEGESRAYRHPQYMENALADSNIQTLFDSVMNQYRLFPHNRFLGTLREDHYEWKTYQEAHELAKNFGSGLVNLNLSPKEKHGKYNLSFLGLYSKNREEWVIADYACILYNITTVPFYDTLGEDSMKFIISQTRMHTLLLTKEKIQKVLKLKHEGSAESLNNLIIMEQASDEDRANARAVGITLYDFQDIISHGIKNQAEYNPPSPDDIFTITYTSGTTGDSKGVITTHLNFISSMVNFHLSFTIHANDIHISYLPIAHIYERYLFHYIAYNGAAAGFYRGDPLKLRDDLAILKPSIFATVPRILNRFYDLINGYLSKPTGNKAIAIKRAIAVKLENLKNHSECSHKFYDFLIFKKIRMMLGNNIRLCALSSAPISPDILNFMKIALCCPIVECYGLTEAGPVTISNINDPESGHIGGPILGVEIKLVDIPEMGYTSHYVDEKTQQKFAAGEICFRGPNVTKGYFKLKEITREVIDEEGWFHTGDVGLIRNNGSLKVIDRKKNIFKLAQGEYVAPIKIENAYMKSRDVALVFVYGDSLQNYLIGIVIPEKAEVEAWAKDHDIKGNWEEICKNPAVVEMVLNDMNRIGKESKLNGFELVKKVYLYPNMVAPGTLFLTSTFKINRYQARKYFQEQIDSLYSSQ
ncbi:unnamed protein product [Blepharisma stoltei]|uniref:AMP-dependent synthetase/ligase domain-containing protein n=1 Tax=Blepharisma stoltei TaxID=1481888 RepID=A0AAU9J329_9CILI|nr:unnamed protein product [Blepharisma stoltei]